VGVASPFVPAPSKASTRSGSRGPQTRIKVQRNANTARNADPRNSVARWRKRAVVVVPAYFRAIPNSRPVFFSLADSARLRPTMWLPPLGGIVNCSGNKKGEREKTRQREGKTHHATARKKNTWPSTNVFLGSSTACCAQKSSSG
jgi:hypothetical protein